MSGQNTFHWIISSEKLNAGDTGVDPSSIIVEGQAKDEYLLILKNSESSADQTRVTEDLAKRPSVKSSVLYTEVSG